MTRHPDNLDSSEHNASRRSFLAAGVATAAIGLLPQGSPHNGAERAQDVVRAVEDEAADRGPEDETTRHLARITRRFRRC